MNKLALSAVALLVLALLALPRFVGSLTEARVRERVAAIDASPTAAAAGHLVRPRLVPQHGADRAALRPRQCRWARRRRGRPRRGRHAAGRPRLRPRPDRRARRRALRLVEDDRASRHHGARRHRAAADPRRAVLVRVPRPHELHRRARLRRRRPAVRVADRRGTAHVLGRDARRHLRGAPTRRQRADRRGAVHVADGHVRRARCVCERGQRAALRIT